MGEELPLGVLAFHRTLRSRLISEGKPRSDETPAPFGPRKGGQSAAAKTAAEAKQAARNRTNWLFYSSRSGWLGVHPTPLYAEASVLTAVRVGAYQYSRGGR